MLGSSARVCGVFPPRRPQLRSDRVALRIDGRASARGGRPRVERETRLDAVTKDGHTLSAPHTPSESPPEEPAPSNADRTELHHHAARPHCELQFDRNVVRRITAVFCRSSPSGSVDLGRETTLIFRLIFVHTSTVALGTSFRVVVGRCSDLARRSTATDISPFEARVHSSRIPADSAANSRLWRPGCLAASARQEQVKRANRAFTTAQSVASAIVKEGHKQVS